jgi:hypothetical protein
MLHLIIKSQRSSKGLHLRSIYKGAIFHDAQNSRVYLTFYLLILLFKINHLNRTHYGAFFKSGAKIVKYAWDKRLPLLLPLFSTLRLDFPL